MQAPAIADAVDLINVVDEEVDLNEDDWDDEDDADDEELHDFVRLLRYMVCLVIYTVAIGISCIFAICTMESSEGAWNDSVSRSSSSDDDGLPAMLACYLVLVPALLVAIMGFLSSRRRKPRLLAVYLGAMILLLMVPFVVPSHCVGPEPTTKHVTPKYTCSFLDTVLRGEVPPFWMWSSLSGPVLVVSFIAARFYQATNIDAPQQHQFVGGVVPWNTRRLNRARG